MIAGDDTEAVERVAARIGFRARNPHASADELGRLAGWWDPEGTAPTLVPADVTPRPGLTTAGAVEAGVAAVDAAVDGGATLVVPRVTATDLVRPLVVIALLTHRDPSAVVHQPEGMADREWIRRCADVRDGCARHAALRGEPIALLTALDDASTAFAAGALLAAAARRAPAIVGGMPALAGALVADRVTSRAGGWWRAASTSPDIAQVAAVDRIGMDRGLPLGVAADDDRGVAATLALLELALCG